jgi:hypothetical protein
VHTDRFAATVGSHVAMTLRITPAVAS